MDLENFRLYTTDDFILDEEFREIVRESDSIDQLKELLENLPEKRAEIELAAEVLRGLQVKAFQQSDVRKKELWQLINQSQKSKVRFLYFRVAASLLLLLGIGSAIYYSTLPKQMDKVAVAIQPSSVNATLILADGKRVSIGAKQSKVKYSADGSGIMVNDSSSIAQSAESNGLNQMIVPFGKRSFVMLAEGTKVWLNSGSKLIFPAVFKGGKREVYLEGEALFEVTKDITKPFFVKTERFTTKVYGTKFNIQAYDQDEDYSIVLVEGKVSMSSDDQSPEVFLAPNQRATLSKGKAAFEITTIENTSYYTAWVDGYLAFNNEKVPNVLKRVSRYYNVAIESELDADTEKIYGKLDLKDDLGRVLDGIAFISKTKFEKRGDKYVFLNN